MALKAFSIDGNNVLEVYDTVKRLAESMREKPRPVITRVQHVSDAWTRRGIGHEVCPKRLNGNMG